MSVSMSEPDYTLPVDVSIPSRSSPLISGVTCKVFLPKRVADPITLQFLPREDQASYLGAIPNCSVAGTISGASGNLQTSIQADDVVLQCRTKSWSSGLSETICEGKPARLRILTNLPASKPESSSSKRIGHFWLTPSGLLRPRKDVEPSLKGNVKVRNVQIHRFALPDGIRLVFDTQFRYERNDSGELITFEELVAQFRPKKSDWPKWDVAHALNFIDEYLLLVSFAERRRCACIGLDMISPSMS